MRAGVPCWVRRQCGLDVLQTCRRAVVLFRQISKAQGRARRRAAGRAAPWARARGGPCSAAQVARHRGQAPGPPRGRAAHAAPALAEARVVSLAACPSHSKCSSAGQAGRAWPGGGEWARRPARSARRRVVLRGGSPCMSRHARREEGAGEVVRPTLLMHIAFFKPRGGAWWYSRRRSHGGLAHRARRARARAARSVAAAHGQWACQAPTRRRCARAAVAGSS